ncbi:unnamed protein product [Prorocentrum cordatum]|uniref:Uncharacterized protein n=1 Tax=Prorocentrum cordatum TaxID=2364126 RepID=A0ABN9XMM2_9DINO|nr:unnamed protein product [Polarella glacialis]
MGFASFPAAIGDTKKFAFVYPTAFFAAGGFVYLNAEAMPIAVNQLSVNCTSRGFRMGGMQSMTLDVANQLEPNTIPTTLPAIRGKGARRFCFVGPGQLGDGDFMSNTFGGFAYWFDDVQKHRFFSRFSDTPEW